MTDVILTEEHRVNREDISYLFRRINKNIKILKYDKNSSNEEIRQELISLMFNLNTYNLDDPWIKELISNSYSFNRPLVFAPKQRKKSFASGARRGLSRF